MIGEYKETSIGEIPIDWQVRKVRDIFSVETGTTPSTKRPEYWEEGSVNWLTPRDLSKLNGTIRISGSERKITEKAMKETSLTLMPKGSIIISTRAPVGYVAVLDEPATFNQGCKGLILKNSNKVSSEFYSYYLLNKKYMLENLSGGSTFKELSKRRLESFDLPFISFAEQQRIAEVLSCVDDATQKIDEGIEKTERLKRGLMHKLLTEGIGHKEFKQTKIGKIPKTWKVLSLGDILTDIKYGTSTKANNETEGFPVLGIPNILGGKIDESKLRYVDLPETEIEKFTLKDADILVVRTNANPDYIGRCALFKNMKGTWVYASYLIRIRPDKSSVLPEYLVKFLQSKRARRQFLSRARTSAGNYNINTQGIRSIVTYLPNLSEQLKIANIISAVDENLELNRDRKGKLERIKTGLMNDLLMGRRRVKVEM